MTFQNPYIASEIITGNADIATNEPFLLPLCLTYAQYADLLGALYFARGLYAGTEDFYNIDHMLSVLIAQQWIDDPTNAPCWPVSECDFCDTIQAIIDTVPAGPEAFLTELATKLVECCTGISLPPAATDFPELCDLLTAQTGTATDIPTLVQIAQDCGITVSFDFDAQAITLAPGSLATATYDNAQNKFIFGIPRGEPGVQGEVGPPGVCDCEGVNDEPPPENQTSAACGAANNVIVKLDDLWQRMLLVIANNPSDEFAVLEEVTGIYRLIYSFAGSLIQFIVTNGLQSWQNAITDQSTALACDLYCNGITKTNVLTYFQNTPAITAEPLLLSALEQLVSSVTDEQWNEWVSLGKLKDTGGACDQCNCSDGWCYTWDFTVGNGGWTSTANNGQYDAGIGFVERSDNPGEIQIKRTFTGTTITEFEVELSEAFQGLIPRWQLEYDSGGVNQYTQTGNPAGQTIITVTSTSDPGIDEIRFYLDTRFGDASLQSWPGAITRVTLLGTGANPFGTDNC